MAELACVPPYWIERFWPLAKPYVQAAVDATDMMTVNEIAADVLAGRALLWIAFDDRQDIIGAGTTELRRTEHSLVCVITSWAAKVHQPQLLAIVEDYARAEGCDCIRLFGRRGWARKLKDHYVQRHVVLERQLR